MAFIDAEARAERARNLGAMNGFDRVLVTLPAGPDPAEGYLDVYFHNDNGLADIVADPRDPKEIFPIHGGHRVRAGPGSDEVGVVDVAAGSHDHVLRLVVRPVGDYSTYTLTVQSTDMDPVFAELPFKFRPGCFTTDCDPEWASSPPRPREPRIDYLAKDYDSFRHALIAAMQRRVPGWEPTSEADLGVALIDLFSAAADELSDYQDRVANEAFWGRARNRVTIARHARLMDYHIHQGNQASTWLALRVADGTDFVLLAGFEAWTGDAIDSSGSVVFRTRDAVRMHHLLNTIGLYDWSGARPGLAAGDTEADLRLGVPGESAANAVRDMIHDGDVTRLLIQEHLNPQTGHVPGRNPAKRQLLRLLPGDEGATTDRDPLTGDWFVRVHWREEDRLHHDYCFTAITDEGDEVGGISAFHGNLVHAFHGRRTTCVFKDPEERLIAPDEHHYERTRWGAVCRLPEDSPVLYRNTPPGGEHPPESTLEAVPAPTAPDASESATVRVELPGGGSEIWEEVAQPVNSRPEDEHFVLETDELGRSAVRFGFRGDGREVTHGRELPERAFVRVAYQTGRGPDGNVGADRVRHSDAPGIEACWNPFDVTDGRAPEPVDQILRNVPEAYRTRQFRAITLDDYVDRAEEVDGVSAAAAAYDWTGSWRTVRVAIDPVGTAPSGPLDPALRERVFHHLEAVRLIGEDLEIRPPVFVPLRIRLVVCATTDAWPADVRARVRREFSDGYLPDGRPGFFHPDRWTFGQPLRASQIVGRVQAVPGVDHVVRVEMKRWDAPTPGTADTIAVDANEVIQVKNDPDHMERGTIEFDIRGGRS